jgi:hypothetical protein
MANYTIPLATAQAAARSWQRNPPRILVKGHLIKGEALRELLAIEGVVDVRAYMGVDSSGMQDLVYVGVDANGKDLIDEANGYYVYNGTQPCPSNCDTSSPLFNP